MIRGNQEEVCMIHASQKGKFLYWSHCAYIDIIKLANEALNCKIVSEYTGLHL